MASQSLIPAAATASRQSLYDYRRRLNTENAIALQPRSRRLRPHRGRRTPWSKRGSWAMRTVTGIPSAMLNSPHPMVSGGNGKPYPRAAVDALWGKSIRILHPGV